MCFLKMKMITNQTIRLTHKTLVFVYVLSSLLATFSAAIRSLISDTFFGVISVIKYFFVVRDSVFVLLLSVFVNFVRCVVIFVVR